uniref:HA2 domain-containing protein n=1 Tax=Macrostomum lignano TaxID=282301 RepID=A0A1I8F4Q9_9PLAT
ILDLTGYRGGSAAIAASKAAAAATAAVAEVALQRWCGSDQLDEVEKDRNNDEVDFVPNSSFVANSNADSDQDSSAAVFLRLPQNSTRWLSQAWTMNSREALDSAISLIRSGLVPVDRAHSDTGATRSDGRRRRAEKAGALIRAHTAATVTDADDCKVDCELVVKLLQAIHQTYPMQPDKRSGAVLIFVPGFEDIIKWLDAGTGIVTFQCAWIARAAPINAAVVAVAAARASAFVCTPDSGSLRFQPYLCREISRYPLEELCFAESTVGGSRAPPALLSHSPVRPLPSAERAQPQRTPGDPRQRCGPAASDWLIYNEAVRTGGGRIAHIRCATLPGCRPAVRRLLPPAADYVAKLEMALSTDHRPPPTQLPPRLRETPTANNADLNDAAADSEIDIGADAEQGQGDGDFDDADFDDEDFDESDDEPRDQQNPQAKQRQRRSLAMSVDKWIRVRSDRESLRCCCSCLSALLLRRIRHPAKLLSFQDDEAVLKALVNVLTYEEQALASASRPVGSASLWSQAQTHCTLPVQPALERRLSGGSSRCHIKLRRQRVVLNDDWRRAAAAGNDLGQLSQTRTEPQLASSSASSSLLGVARLRSVQVGQDGGCRVSFDWIQRHQQYQHHESQQQQPSAPVADCDLSSEARGAETGT